MTVTQRLTSVIFPTLLSDAKHNMLCFATSTFACTVRGQSLQNQIEKICFLHFSITSYSTQEPISHTMCQFEYGIEEEQRVVMKTTMHASRTAFMTFQRES